MDPDWNEPKDTVKLLDELVTLGFTDDAFRRLHHFREKDKNDTIKNHRKYCARTGFFRFGSKRRAEKRSAFRR